MRMQIVCPNCMARFRFDPQKVGVEGIKLRCGKCRAIFRVLRKALAQVAPAVKPAPPSACIRVVVANESAAFCQAVKKVLESEPFAVYIYNDGKEAMAAIEQLMPEVVLLDVALPSMYGFEVCEAIKNNPALTATKVVLIASIYDKTRYKRAPQSLYGADDYIEKHHIPDSLATMIYRLVSGQQPVEAATGMKPPIEEEAQSAPEELSRHEMDDQEATRRQLRQAEECATISPPTPSAPELPEVHIKARRLARIIVSDIILYNQAKVETGVRNDSFYELLADDIQEGRSLYQKRVPEEVRTSTNYLEEAFGDLLAKKKREFGL
ncbi:MAG: response regulator [Geobacteraceae bacterium]